MKQFSHFLPWILGRIDLSRGFVSPTNVEAAEVGALIEVPERTAWGGGGDRGHVFTCDRPCFTYNRSCALKRFMVELSGL